MLKKLMKRIMARKAVKPVNELTGKAEAINQAKNKVKKYPVQK